MGLPKRFHQQSHQRGSRLSNLSFINIQVDHFPSSIGHVEMTVIDLFEQVQNHANPSLAIVVETIRSLNICRRKSGERFMGCLLMLYVGSKATSNVRQVPSRSLIFLIIFQPRNSVKVSGPDPRPRKDRYLFTNSFWCGDSVASTMDAICSFTLSVWRQALSTAIRIMEAVSYAPLMVVRQFGGKQFIPSIKGLAQLEFS